MQLRFYKHESSAHQSNLADEIIACGRFSILRSNSAYCIGTVLLLGRQHNKGDCQQSPSQTVRSSSSSG